MTNTPYRSDFSDIGGRLGTALGGAQDEILRERGIDIYGGVIDDDEDYLNPADFGLVDTSQQQRQQPSFRGAESFASTAPTPAAPQPPLSATPLGALARQFKGRAPELAGYTATRIPPTPTAFAPTATPIAPDADLPTDAPVQPVEVATQVDATPGNGDGTYGTISYGYEKPLNNSTGNIPENTNIANLLVHLSAEISRIQTLIRVVKYRKCAILNILSIEPARNVPLKVSKSDSLVVLIFL